MTADGADGRGAGHVAGSGAGRVDALGAIGTIEPAALARSCAEQMHARDRASQALGIAISEVAPGRAVARMTVTEAMVNGHDICHGGVVFTLADSAFAFACNTYGVVTVAAGADITFVAPARLGDELVAEGVERSRFGRSGLYDVTVRRADGTLIAEFRGRSRQTNGRFDGPAAGS